MTSRTVPTFLAAVALICIKASANTTAAINSNSHNRTNAIAEYCNSSIRSGHMWGAADPNVYYICDEVSNTTRQLRCPAGRGFFNGRGYYGCIPYGEWPACIGSDSSNATTQGCQDEEHMQQTWAAVDPNKFYICQEENATPLLLNCEPDKGYVSVGTSVRENGGHGRTNIVGCATWTKWRIYMQCVDFY